MTGDIARLASGRVVARHQVTFADGTVGCRLCEPVEVEKLDAWRIGPAPRDWTTWMDNEIDQLPGLYRPLEPRAEEVEFARWRREWPYVSAQLLAIGVGELPTRVTRFDVGKVFYPCPGGLHGTGGSHWHPRVLLAKPSVPWRAFLEDHAAGIFGVYGEWNDAPLNPEELFTLAEQPVLVANKAAIAAKSGPVRSRFLLPADNPQPVVDVVTVLSQRGPRTLMTCAYAEAG